MDHQPTTRPSSARGIPGGSLQRFLVTLWQFSRPHTLVGSFVSITALYAIAARDFHSFGALLTILLPSLLSALASNVYITGLNQWCDLDVDRINKPWLPIPAGRLTRERALHIVLVCGLLALALAVWFGPFFLGLIFLILAIGTAYSMPPLKLKRHHLGAAAAISLVRGLLVNLGFYLHFRYQVTGYWQLDAAVWPLTLFVIAFSLGIAWFKDIPDTAGDAAYRFGTLAVKAGRRPAFLAGVMAVTLAYLYVILAACWGQLPAALYFIATHAAALLAFWWQARRLEVRNNRQVKQFYLFFWGLFFLEYLLYPLGFYF